MARLDVREIQLYCVIKGCGSDSVLLERHHVKSQKLFVWHFRRRRSKKYRAFAAAYYRFNKKDCVRICRDHHEVAHNHYHGVIAKHCAKLRLRLKNFSWRQAEILMDDLEREFYLWKAREEARLAHTS